MTCLERAILFHCQGAALVGVVTQPVSPSEIGVLIVVGGPQYRAGSHRQFVHLARRLTEHGIASIRFDYRGMGDSEGAPQSFDAVYLDIAAAASALRKQIPQVRRLVLWGLCDGASAALMAVPALEELAGVVALNPWVRTEAGADKALVNHYYGRRLLSAAFWRKLARGEVQFVRAGLEFIKRACNARRVRHKGIAAYGPSFQLGMLAGLQKLRAPALFVLSGRDLTAAEFEALCASDAEWSRTLKESMFEIVRLHDADHTCSSAASRRAVEELTVRFVLGQAAVGSTAAASR